MRIHLGILLFLSCHFCFESISSPSNQLTYYLQKISNALFDGSFPADQNEFLDAIKYYDFSRNIEYKNLIESEVFRQLAKDSLESDEKIVQNLLHEYFQIEKSSGRW